MFLKTNAIGGSWINTAMVISLHVGQTGSDYVVRAALTQPLLSGTSTEVVDLTGTYATSADAQAGMEKLACALSGIDPSAFA